MTEYEIYKQKYGEKFDHQLQLEAEFKQLAETLTETNLQNQVANEQYAFTGGGKHLLKMLFDSMYKNITIFIEESIKPKAGVRPSYVSFLLDIKNTTKKAGSFEAFVREITLIVIASSLNNCFLKRPLSLSLLGNKIGKAIGEEYNLEYFIQTNSEGKFFIETGLPKRVGEAYKRAYVARVKRHSNYKDKYIDSNVLTLLGTTLLYILADTTPLFEIGMQDDLKFLSATQELIAFYVNSNEKQILNSYKFMPMVIPPKEWEDFYTGAYYGALSNAAKLCRVETSSSFSKHYLKVLAQVDITNVLKSVNALQNTPWHINTQVLSVVNTLVKQGGGRANLPFFDKMPPPTILPSNPTAEDIAEYKKLMIPYYKKETRRQSLALHALGIISTANKFKNEDTIYFPCNMDFRGRVYPIPAFNFQGDDLAKGLLVFADVPPIHDEEALKWLKIHGANLAGVDKVSFADRIKWVEEHEQQILEVADNPLDCTWWQEQDSPFQFLGFCLEWRKIVDYMKEHHTIVGFKSELPIAFDGTCSGLQHFSAILRDEVGGSAVNLIPHDKPNDIYGIVAQKVNDILLVDVQQGTIDEYKKDKKGEDYLKLGTKTLAQLWLAYGVNRKVTKRPTMTLAYGAKAYGFKEQIMEDTIKPAMRNIDSVFSSENAHQAAMYMSKLIWKAVGDTVIKATEAMSWLQQCANIVAKKGKVITWVTPMGLPVQQSYLKYNTILIRPRIFGHRVVLYNRKETGDIDVKGQTTGIAPNFIHSMDAAHLQLTICKCLENNIHHFSMIHDSYATSAGQATELFQIVRKSFVEMYTKNDVLKDFKEALSEACEQELPEPPAQGNLDIYSVLKSDYIFS